MDRTIKLAANFTLTSTKPIGRAETAVFDILHRDISGPLVDDRGPVATNPGGTVPVQFTNEHKIPALDAASSDDGKYLVNRITISFYSGFAGSSALQQVFAIRLTANYLFTPATPAIVPELLVDHMEIVQVVQTPDNTVPIIPSKSTVVRVFLQSKGDNAQPFTGITGTLTADELDVRAKLITDAQHPTTAPVTPPDRDNQSHSLNFLILDNLTPKEGLVLHLRVKLGLDSGRALKQTTNPNTDPFQAPPFTTPPNWPPVFRVYHMNVCAFDYRSELQMPSFRRFS